MVGGKEALPEKTAPMMCVVRRVLLDGAHGPTGHRAQLCCAPVLHTYVHAPRRGPGRRGTHRR